MFKRLSLILLVIAALVLAACEATPTPLPAGIDAGISTAPAFTGRYRYAIAPNIAGLVIDIYNIEPHADVIYLDQPPTLMGVGTQYEYAVALGEYEGAERAFQDYEVSLIMRTDVEPLDDPAVQAIIRRAAVPAELVAGLDIPGLEIVKDEPVGDLRADLASAGYPDGFDLKITSIFAPGIEAFAERLREAGINVEIVAVDAPDAMVALGAWGSLPTRIPLFRAPLSYWIAPNVPLNPSNNGLPLPFEPGG